MFKHFKLSLSLIKLNILSAMEYRVSFVLQVIGMLINDVGLIFMWYIFFQKFNSVNGWQFSDTILVFAVSCANFGLFRIIAAGAEEINYYINRGQFDHFLTLPKSPLWQVSLSTSNISAIGDFVCGIALFFFFTDVTWVTTATFVIATVATAVTMYSYVVATQSLGFYFGNFEETAERLFGVMLGLTFYPSTSIFGFLKLLTFTIIPVFFISWAPVSILKIFDWRLFIGMIAFAFVSFLIARTLFYKGLKRYESGNLIHVKL